MNTEREQPEGEENNLHDMDTERDSLKAKRTTYMT
jgi:hypothetical protein